MIGFCWLGRGPTARLLEQSHLLKRRSCCTAGARDIRRKTDAPHAETPRCYLTRPPESWLMRQCTGQLNNSWGKISPTKWESVDSPGRKRLKGSWWSGSKTIPSRDQWGENRRTRTKVSLSMSRQWKPCAMCWCMRRAPRSAPSAKKVGWNGNNSPRISPAGMNRGLITFARTYEVSYKCYNIYRSKL